MKKSLFLLPLLAGSMLCGCGESPAPVPEPEHTHTFSADWSSNADKHWHSATCGHDVKSAEGAHVDSNGDQKCDVCAYPMPAAHTHTFAAEWSSDKDGHWHEATCGHDVKSGEGAHVDGNADGYCDTCNYKMSSPVPAGTVVLDFTDSSWKEQKITPFVEDNTTVLQFTYDGINYNDAGCYANVYSGTYWLMMKNKWEDGKVVAGESFAFIGNAESYGSAIDKVVVTTSKQGGAVDFYVDFGASAFESSSCKGTKKSVGSEEVTFTATNTGDSEFFAITAAKDVGEYRKNGGIAKVEIYLK